MRRGSRRSKLTSGIPSWGAAALGAAGLMLAIGLSDGGAPRTHATEPEPHAGDLVIQFGQLAIGCGDGCTMVGDPSDRIDFLSPLNGALVSSWESGFFASWGSYGPGGMDVSNGDGVLLPIEPEYDDGVNYYAVRLAAEDGTLLERWGLTAPAEIWPNAIAAAPEDNDPLVSDGDIYEATSSTTVDALEIEGATVLGVMASTVAYAVGRDLGVPGRVVGLANRFTGVTIVEEAAPPEYRDAHVTPDGHGVLVAPGHTGWAEYVPLGSQRAVAYQVPLAVEPDCGPLSADASGDRVFVLAACEFGNAVVYSFNRVTGDYIGIVKIYPFEELETLGSFPIRIRVYGSSDPSSRAVIYVHGAKTSAHAQTDFSAVLGNPSIESSPLSHVVNFYYWQDSGCDDEPTPFPVMPTLDTSTEMHVDSHVGGARCEFKDSQSSISENVRRLHSLIADEYYASGNTPVILMGYSTGAAIIRGVITYSRLRDDGLADTMIDTVITVAGAHDGSEEASCAYGSRCDVWYQYFQREAARIAIGKADYKSHRPLVYDLAANDDWYEWANQEAAGLPGNIAYFNFYADIDAKYCEHGVLPSLSGPWVPWVVCHGYPMGAWGDGVLAAGTSYPYDTPTSGGARFSRPSTREQWESQLRYGPFNMLRISGNPLKALDYPAFHSKIPDNTPRLSVPKCREDAGSARITLAEQLTRVILAKTGRPYSYPCPLHEVIP